MTIMQWLTCLVSPLLVTNEPMLSTRKLSTPRVQKHRAEKQRRREKRLAQARRRNEKRRRATQNAAPKKKRWFWQKEPIPEANPEEKIKPAPV